MTSNWTTVKLSEVAKIIGGGTPSTSESNYWDGNIPWITPKDLSSHKDMYISSGSRSITDAGLKNSSAKLVPKDTVLFTSRAPIGYVAIAAQSVCTNQGFKSLVLNEGYDSRYFYYLLKHYTPEIEARATGSTFKEISGTALGSFEISMPPAYLQKRISDILGTLDDRISLLRETNQTLEAIAQALFKSWFVDFDPVRAKAEGRVPEGIDAESAALFPDAFDETELGVVPKGWAVTSVGAIAEVVKGKSYSSKDLVENHKTALVTLKSFERGGGFRMDGFKPYSGTYKSTQVVSAGDLIIAYTDVTQAAELIGKPAIVVAVEEHDTLVASLDVGIVRPDASKCGKQFLYGLFKTDAFQSHTYAHTSGTTVLHLSKDGVGSYRFALPPAALNIKFEEIASALAKRRQANTDGIRALGTLRDTLLPRLISGQLRIADPEAELEKAIA